MSAIELDQHINEAISAIFAVEVVKGSWEYYEKPKFWCGLYGDDKPMKSYLGFYCKAFDMTYHFWRSKPEHTALYSKQLAREHHGVVDYANDFNLVGPYMEKIEFAELRWSNGWMVSVYDKRSEGQASSWNPARAACIAMIRRVRSVAKDSPGMVLK